MKSFQRWCEDNGRLSVNCKFFQEFEKNCKDYEAYLEKFLKENKVDQGEATNDS